MPPIPGIRVVRSPIHGYGVIATRNFAEGELIAEVDGIVWNEEEEVDDSYSLWLEDGVYFDMLDQTRWINHSCEPNAEIAGEAEPEPWAQVLAARDIKAGEEILYDYAFSPEVAEPCSCRTATCRGYIVDVDELPRLKRMIAAGETKFSVLTSRLSADP